MKSEFLIQRQGKTYCLFAGLLDEAHERGLLGIDTELLQVPTAENGEVAICKATVRMPTEEGIVATYSGIGDASPGNVGRGIVPHIIRMAETRSKARALRDAINVNVAAFEEAGGEDEEAPPRGGPRDPGAKEPLTRNQFGKLLGELEAGKYTREAFEKRHGPVGNLTKGQAARHIERLVEANRARPTVMAPGEPYPEEVE